MKSRGGAIGPGMGSVLFLMLASSCADCLGIEELERCSATESCVRDDSGMPKAHLDSGPLPKVDSGSTDVTSDAPAAPDSTPPAECDGARAECSGETPRECVDGTWVDGVLCDAGTHACRDGACVPLLEPGARGCADDADCVADTVCVDDVCMIATCRADGEPCPDQWHAACCGGSRCYLGECVSCVGEGAPCGAVFTCCEGLFCDAGRCRARLGEGQQYCDESAHCEAPLYCASDRTCTRKKDSGPCEGSIECAAMHECCAAGTAGTTCREPLPPAEGTCEACPVCEANGASCCGQAVCGPLGCSGPALACTKGSTGASCTGPDDCCSDHCVDRACAASCQDLAGPCEADVDCCSGTCAGNACHLAECKQSGEDCTAHPNCCSYQCGSSGKCN